MWAVRELRKQACLCLTNQAFQQTDSLSTAEVGGSGPEFREAIGDVVLVKEVGLGLGFGFKGSSWG